MRRVRNAADGLAHFSELKWFERSPAHYLAACEGPRKPPTREMVIGFLTHVMVLGRRPLAKQIVLWPHKSRTKKGFKEFAKEHDAAEIVTQPEWDQAARVADKVRTSLPARRLLAGCTFEVPTMWTDVGIECGTAGIDAIGRDPKGRDCVVELKVTTNTQPERFSLHALRYLYLAQLAFYATGAIANGRSPGTVAYIISVEDSPPHVVTVLEIQPEMLDIGRKQVRKWLERLRSCEEADFWPGYAQDVVPFEVPAWLSNAEQEAVVYE